jgi:hypothetical protein
MVSLRTGNRRRRKAHRRQVLYDAFEFDLKQLRRMSASGTLHKRANSYYVRKTRRAYVT